MPPLASHKWMRVEAQRLPLLLQLAQLAQPQLLERQVQLLALERAPHLSISLWFSSFSCCQILREHQQLQQGSTTSTRAEATTAKSARRTQKNQTHSSRKNHLTNAPAKTNHYTLDGTSCQRALC